MRNVWGLCAVVCAADKEMQLSSKAKRSAEEMYAIAFSNYTGDIVHTQMHIHTLTCSCEKPACNIQTDIEFVCVCISVCHSV